MTLSADRGNIFWSSNQKQQGCPNSFQNGSEYKGGFPVIAETTRNHIFSKEFSQVMLAAMVLELNFYCKNCLRVILGMRGNPP